MTKTMENQCRFFLPKKNRFCANLAFSNSLFCGNHSARSDDRWIPCSIDPSHSVLERNLESHLKRCPLLKHKQSLSVLPFYQKGINGGAEEGIDDYTSELKRKAVYSMSIPQMIDFIAKIKSIHASICNDVRDSYQIPEACSSWINQAVDRNLPFQEKHVSQQASILGNLERLGVLKPRVRPPCSNSVESSDAPAIVEFGAGRGYLTQMLADCYWISKVFLVERKSYKLKADRSLRQDDSLMLERLRIDIEDLNLNAIESLSGFPFLAIGKHLCGPATDMTLRCCVGENSKSNVAGAATCHLRGLAIATCCHHLCQWKHYINKSYMLNLGITMEDFHAITWFTSWAVDADHGSDLADVVECRSDIQIIKVEKGGSDQGSCLVDNMIRNMSTGERAILGFMCKDIIDAGRLMWIKERGLQSEFVNFVPSNISPENHLLIACKGLTPEHHQLVRAVEIIVEKVEENEAELQKFQPTESGFEN